MSKRKAVVRRDDIHPMDLTIAEIEEQLRIRHVEPKSGKDIRKADLVKQLQDVMKEETRKCERQVVVRSSIQAANKQILQTGKIAALSTIILTYICNFLDELQDIARLARCCGDLRAVCSLRLSDGESTPIFGHLRRLDLWGTGVVFQKPIVRFKICSRFTGVVHADLARVEYKAFLAFCQGNGATLQSLRVTLRQVPRPAGSPPRGWRSDTQGLARILLEGLGHCTKLRELTLYSSPYTYDVVHAPGPHERAPPKLKPLAARYADPSIAIHMHIYIYRPLLTVTRLTLDMAYLYEPDVQGVLSIFPRVQHLAVVDALFTHAHTGLLNVGGWMPDLRVLDVRKCTWSLSGAFEATKTMRIDSSSCRHLHTLLVDRMPIRWTTAADAFVPLPPPPVQVLNVSSAWVASEFLIDRLPRTTRVLILTESHILRPCRAAMQVFSQVHTLMLAHDRDLDSDLTLSLLWRDMMVDKTILPKLKFLDLAYHGSLQLWAPLYLRDTCMLPAAVPTTVPAPTTVEKVPEVPRLHALTRFSVVGNPSLRVVSPLEATLDGLRTLRQDRPDVFVRMHYRCRDPLPGDKHCPLCPSLGVAPSRHHDHQMTQEEAAEAFRIL